MLSSNRVCVRRRRRLTTSATVGATVLSIWLTAPMSAPTASAASAPTPVVIGDICSCTGPLASTAQQTGPGAPGLGRGPTPTAA